MKEYRELGYVYNCFFQAEDGIRELVRSRGLGDVYKRQATQFSQANTRSKCHNRRKRKNWVGFEAICSQHRPGKPGRFLADSPDDVVDEAVGVGKLVFVAETFEAVSYTHLTLPTIYPV